MNKYEMLYILDVSLSDEAKAAIISKFETTVTTDGGTIDAIDKWGAKKLAYPINFKDDGYYVLMTFEAKPSLVAELERIAGITDGVIRRLITKA